MLSLRLFTSFLVIVKNKEKETNIWLAELPSAHSFVVFQPFNPFVFSLKFHLINAWRAMEHWLDAILVLTHATAPSALPQWKHHWHSQTPNRGKGLLNPSQPCLHMEAWSYSHWGQWELCHQLQWEQDGALMLWLHWNGVQAHSLPRCGLLSFYSCTVVWGFFVVVVAVCFGFFLIGNNNFIEFWPVVLAQTDQTRCGCSNKGSWNIKHKRGHMTTASPSLATQASSCCTSAWVHPPGPQLLRPARTWTRAHPDQL